MLTLPLREALRDTSTRFHRSPQVNIYAACRPNRGAFSASIPRPQSGVSQTSRSLGSAVQKRSSTRGGRYWPDPFRLAERPVSAGTPRDENAARSVNPRSARIPLPRAPARRGGLAAGPGTSRASATYFRASPLAHVYPLRTYASKPANRTSHFPVRWRGPNRAKTRLNVTALPVPAPVRRSGEPCRL